MSNRQPLLDRRTSPRIPLVDMQVGPADTCSQNTNLDVVDAHLGLGNIFEPKTAFFAAFYQCLHLENLSCCVVHSIAASLTRNHHSISTGLVTSPTTNPEAIR